MHSNHNWRRAIWLRRHSRLILSSALVAQALMAQSGCALSYVYEPTEESARRLTPQNAQKMVANSLRSCHGDAAEFTVYPDHFTLVSNGGGESRHYYKDLGDIHLVYDAETAEPDHIRVGYRVRIVNTGQGKELGYVVTSCDVAGDVPAGDDGKLLADAILRLRVDYDATYGAAAEAAFERSVTSYRLGSSVPPLPPDIEMLHSQAKVAIARKNFLTATELYKKALSLAPWWPDGHFNLALILGEMDATDAASVEMQRYLYLSPAASDDVTAKAKLVDWSTPVYPVETVSRPSPPEIQVPGHYEFAYFHDGRFGQGGGFRFWAPLPLGTSWSHLFLEVGAEVMFKTGNVTTFAVGSACAQPNSVCSERWDRGAAAFPFVLAYELGTTWRVSFTPHIGLVPYASFAGTGSQTDAAPAYYKSDYGAAPFAGGSVTLGGATRLIVSASRYLTGAGATAWSAGIRF